jgi:hypothetical protein
LDSLGSQPMELDPDGNGPARDTTPQFIIR